MDLQTLRSDPRYNVHVKYVLSMFIEGAEILIILQDCGSNFCDIFPLSFLNS